MTTSYQWTIEDVAEIAKEFGYDPENFVTYLNAFEERTKEKSKKREEEDYEDFQYFLKLANDLGITSAAKEWQAEIARKDAWKAWRTDPENNPFPPSISII